MTYAEKLKDPRWQRKRLEILSRDNWACTVCGNKKISFNVHHLSYSGEPWEAPDDQLTTLCEYCHMFVEKMKFDFSKRKLTCFFLIKEEVFPTLFYFIGSGSTGKMIIATVEDGKMWFNCGIMPDEIQSLKEFILKNLIS